jgi:glyoxylase I family protein
MSPELRVEHIALNVPDPTAMAAWYCEHLEMKVARQGDPTIGMQFLADATGRVAFEIYHNPIQAVPEYATLGPLTLHVAFATPDVEATRKRLLAAGATPIGEIDSTPSGDRLAMLRDPWGLALQLCQRAVPMD